MDLDWKLDADSTEKFLGNLLKFSADFPSREMRQEAKKLTIPWRRDVENSLKKHSDNHKTSKYSKPGDGLMAKNAITSKVLKAGAMSGVNYRNKYGWKAHFFEDGTANRLVKELNKSERRFLRKLKSNSGFAAGLMVKRKNYSTNKEYNRARRRKVRESKADAEAKFLRDKGMTMKAQSRFRGKIKAYRYFSQATARHEKGVADQAEILLMKDVSKITDM